MPWDANRPRGDRKDLELAVRLGSSPPRRVEKPPAQRRHVHPRAPRAGDLPADRAPRNRQTRRGQHGAQASREGGGRGGACNQTLLRSPLRTRGLKAPWTLRTQRPAQHRSAQRAGAAPPPPARAEPAGAPRLGTHPGPRPAASRSVSRKPAPTLTTQAGSVTAPRAPAGSGAQAPRSSHACTRTHATDPRGDAGARPSPTQQNRCCRGPGRGRGRDRGDFRHAGLALTPASLPRACGTPARGRPCVPTRSPRGKQGPGAQDGARLRPRRAEERPRAISRGQDAAALGHARGHGRAQRSGRLTADGEHQGG